MRVDFKEHLRRQLNFIQRSADHYDSGDEEEAIRIATSLRVMFHQKPASTSLLTHLGASRVNLASWCAPIQIPPGAIMFFQCGITAIGLLANANPPRAAYLPRFDGDGNRRLTPFRRWWEGEAIYKRGGSGASQSIEIHRRDIVLWAVNKDGGAHVDAQLPEAYQFLTDGFGFVQAVPGGPTDQGSSVQNAHYAALRHMAFEILNSEELLKLADL